MDAFTTTPVGDTCRLFDDIDYALVTFVAANPNGGQIGMHICVGEQQKPATCTISSRESAESLIEAIGNAIAIAWPTANGGGAT